MPGRPERTPRWHVAVPLLLLLAAGCVTRRVDISLAPHPPKPYASSLHAVFTVGRHGFSASGGCAVDPARGVRVELRDPSGSARLLLLLHRDRAELIALDRGLSFAWSSATDEMPLSPADLWFLFAGRLPAGLRDLQATERGLTYAEWENGEGVCSCKLTPASGPLPLYQAADLRGPRGTALQLTWKGAREGEFPDGTFGLPPGLTPTPASIGEVLQEATP